VIFGPASEVFGRRIPLFAGYVVFAIFQIPVAVAQNVETIMLGRFFGGFAASAPLAVVGGALADIWDPIERAYGICAFSAGGFAGESFLFHEPCVQSCSKKLYAAKGFLYFIRTAQDANCDRKGPVFGPIIGGFVAQSYLGWRWTAWLTLILAALFGVIGFIIIPETSAAKILQTRAKELRYQTKNWALHARADENRIDLRTILTVYLLRPFVMIVQEPILALITAYMSFIYGIVYLLFEAFPISFQQERGWSLGVGALPFASFVVGIAMGAGLIAYSTATNFTKAYKKHGKAIPEERLPPMIIGAIVLPVGLFWFAWYAQSFRASKY